MISSSHQEASPLLEDEQAPRKDDSCSRIFGEATHHMLTSDLSAAASRRILWMVSRFSTEAPSCFMASARRCSMSRLDCRRAGGNSGRSMREEMPCFRVHRQQARLPLSTLERKAGSSGCKVRVSYQFAGWPSKRGRRFTEAMVCEAWAAN